MIEEEKDADGLNDLIIDLNIVIGASVIKKLKLILEADKKERRNSYITY